MQIMPKPAHRYASYRLIVDAQERAVKALAAPK